MRKWFGSSWFWIVSTATLALSVAIISVAWQSYHSGASATSVNLSVERLPEHSVAPVPSNVTLLYSGESANVSLPPPAQKLQKLVGENRAVNLVDAELPQRVEFLNQQVEALNKQLGAQGPSTSELAIAGSIDSSAQHGSPSETTERLNKIKAFVKEKQSPEQR